MKRLAAALMVVAALFSFAAPASAYPPGAVIVNIVRGSPGPVDTTFQVRISGCVPGEEVVFDLPANGKAPVRVVCAADGTATANMTHPPTPGTYTGTVVLEDGRQLSFTITTTADPSQPSIPRTGGGESSSTMLRIGAGAALLGAGLILVARKRRTAIAL